MSKRAIVHVEIPSVSLEKSGVFYREMFGWKVTPMPEMNYALWEPEEGPGGGFSPVGEDSKVGQILIHVDSDDIEADLKKAKALGGSVVREKTEIPDIGWWGLFKDPAGNTIAVYKSMHPQPAK
jgi:predicted enzyme related to lactoylglutathione lyase